VAAAAAVWLEPVKTMLGLGQVDMLLALAVLADLALPTSSRFKGALIGIAAGIKLTPAIFIVYLLITKRYRAAATAAMAFAGTVAIGFAILPASSAYYWSGTFLNPRRIGSVQSGQNESLLGAITRTLHHTNVSGVWLPVAILLAAFGLTLAARAQRGGDEALGFSVCAIIGLLISPISWTHHWVLAVPALLLAALSTYRFRASRKRLATFASAVAIATVAVIAWSRPQFVRGQGGGHWLHASPSAIVYSELYVVAGLVSLVVAAVVVWRRAQASAETMAVG
jgi:alpha-1,2-mannosyltransferase